MRVEKSYTTSAVRKRKWRKENSERYLRNNRNNTWKILGINVEEANHLRDTVKHCQIYNTTEKLHIDHCHVSNKIRGVLCFNCNHGLGNFKDNKDLLSNAIDYLDKSLYN